MVQAKIFEAIKTYSKIWYLSSTLDSKIANLSYEKMKYIIVELIYKFDGLDYLISQLDNIDDEDLLCLIGWFMTVIDQNIAHNILSKLTKSKSERIVFKANSILKDIDNPDELEKTQNVIDFNRNKLKLK